MPKEVPKFGAREVIKFVGVSQLPAEEQATVQTLTTEYYEKIKRKLHNIVNMTVHVKCYQKEGDRRKYSMHVKVAAPTQIFDSSNADDWELPRALHKSFTDILHQIQHKMHTDVTRPDRI
ncbi:hypothetical protein KY319_01330 [Candidatus Woesearchaeota archaeon]|nr:hypothetical protein [Candidatus Woesearchaeota archaeon]